MGKREAVDYLVGEHKLPITRACAHIGLARSSYYERPVTKCKADAPIADALNQVVAKNGRWGFRLCFDYLRSQGHTWNHKRVWRIYKQLGLNLPRRAKKRFAKMPKHPLIAPTQPNTISVVVNKDGRSFMLPVLN